MLIREKALRHWIDHFYGYGSWNAPIWFVAHEESGGELPEEVAQKIDYFLEAHSNTIHPTLCNIRELYRHLTLTSSGTGPSGNFQATVTDSPTALSKTLYEYRFGANAKVNNVWKNLISFAHGFRGDKLPDDILPYQKERFASSSAHQEALIKLYPLPRSNHHAWYYSWLELPEFPFLKNYWLYQEHLFSRRIQAILSNIREHKPQVVLMYAMGNINMLKRSVQDVFPSARFKMIKAVKQHIPQHHLTELEGTKLAITTQIPALRHNRVESGFDWEALGKMLM